MFKLHLHLRYFLISKHAISIYCRGVMSVLVAVLATVPPICLLCRAEFGLHFIFGAIATKCTL